ncbi:hypothetical protein FA13DRAFT_1790908 [Coprinellus micaceus]|uniref:Uncharacterized protein n=1 Tax=Coprinellus micaceus TaxID=71717 RepID=A0A4Y7TEV4_COPMI|nr:hypothetical protein FA13DRAFT_1790908 [Coprinellus micaceus]
MSVMAWIVGSLDSAWATVCKYLGMHHPRKLNDFYRRWGVNDEWRERPQIAGDDGVEEEESDEIPLEENLLFQIGFTHSHQSDTLA